MSSTTPARMTSTPVSETKRRAHLIEQLRRQRFFQQESHWPLTASKERSCLSILVPNETTSELEPVTCALD